MSHRHVDPQRAALKRAERAASQSWGYAQTRITEWAKVALDPKTGMPFSYIGGGIERFAALTSDCDRAQATHFAALSALIAYDVRVARACGY